VLQFLTETSSSAEPVNEMGVALALAHYFEEQKKRTINRKLGPIWPMLLGPIWPMIDS